MLKLLDGIIYQCHPMLCLHAESVVAANILGDQEEADCLEEFEFVRQRASEQDEAVSHPSANEPLYHLTETGEVPGMVWLHSGGT